MTTEELNIKITADTSAATSNIGKAEKSLDQLGNTAENTSDNLDEAGKSAKDASDKVEELGKTADTAGDSLNKFGTEANNAAVATKITGTEADTARVKIKNLESGANGINLSRLKSTLLGLGIGKVLKDSVTNAMDAVESESLFETSLGGLSAQARSWSEKLSNDLGLDGYALRKNVGMLYTMTSSMGLGKQAAYEMSTGLTQLAEDMASFYNLSSEEAFGKLKSGLTGEAEPLKALGILVDENTVKQYAYKTGIAEVGSELTNQQKVLARYQAILGQTSNAQGDLARTADSPANQLRRTMNELQQASIEVGTALMPLVQVALPIVRSVISDIAPLIKDVAGGVSFLSGVLKLMDNPAMKAIAYAAAAITIVNKLNSALGAPTSKLMLILTLLAAFVGKFGTVKSESVSDIAPEMDNAADATDNATDSANDFAKGLGEVEKAAARLASFDKITKLNGSSGDTLASKIVNENDLNNLDKASEAISGIQGQVNGIDVNIPDITIPEITIPEIDVPEFEIDLSKIGENFEKWVQKTNWKKMFLDVGNGLVDVFNGVLGIIDGLLGTHFAEWAKKSEEFFSDVGATVQKWLDPNDDIVNIQKSYAKEHDGYFPEADFYRKVKSGMSIGEAFNEVYSTDELKGLFEARDVGFLSKQIDEWKGKSENEIIDLVMADDRTHEMMMALDPTYRAQYWAGELSVPSGPYIEPPSINGLKPNISTSSISNPLNATEMYKALSAAGAPSSVIRIQTDVNIDGEKVGEAVNDYNDRKASATNGR